MRTPLYEKHLAAGGKIVDFAGWQLPIHYGSQLEEHHAVRQQAGMFDVSHMTIVTIQGEQAQAFLSYLLANDIHKLSVYGKALYTCMLNERGGVIDDLIVYHFDKTHYRLVVNAATREKDLAWIKKQATDFAVTVQEQTDSVMLAVQGPAAREKVHAALPFLKEELTVLKPSSSAELADYFVGRTGYTGEDGYEVILHAKDANAFWDYLLAEGVRPCGLGARDSLRLEAGLNLYGQDMDETTSPLTSNLAWTVSLESERDFIGREALKAEQASGPQQKLVGLVLEAKGIIRTGQTVLVEGSEPGVVTSGGYSPCLNQSIALARVPSETGANCAVEIRGKALSARVVSPPFVRNGKVKV